MTKILTVRNNAHGPRHPKRHSTTCEPRQPPSTTTKEPPASGRSTTHASHPALPSPDPAAPTPGVRTADTTMPPSAIKCLVQVAPNRQDGLGSGAFVPVDAADFHRDRLSESQSPVELLGACPMAASSRSRRSTKAEYAFPCPWMP